MMILATIRPTHARSLRPLLMTLAATFAMADAGPTLAQGEPRALQEAVRFGDLHLASENDAAVLYGRILAAAGRVCVPFEGKGLDYLMRHRACVKSAVIQAVQAVNKSTLTAVHRKRSREGHATSSTT